MEAMEPTNRQEFDAQLQAGGEGDAWTLLSVPFDVATVFGSRARVPVKGTLNGFPFRSSLMPNGDGTHIMLVNKAMQAGAGTRAGERVRVVMEPDTAPRTVAVPADLQATLAACPAAATTFEQLAPSHKQQYVDWIESAKKPETRSRRLEKALGMLSEGKKGLS
jgi:hypothetical protein